MNANTIFIKLGFINMDTFIIIFLLTIGSVLRLLLISNLFRLEKWTTKPHEKYDKAVREGTCERTQINYTTTTNTSETEKLEQRISDQENEIQMLKNRINELEEKLNQ